MQYENSKIRGKIMGKINLEELKIIISIASTAITSVISLITIIITCHNANKQVREAKKARDQQKQQYEETLRLQKEQYEREMEHNRNIEMIHEKPCFVFVESSDFNEKGSSSNTLTITFKNKGNGTAFYIEPDLESINDGNFLNKVHITRNAAIQDHIAMVDEDLKTYWTMDKLNDIVGVVIPITIKYKDASDRLYQQTFKFTIDNVGNVTVINYAIPELVKK